MGVQLTYNTSQGAAFAGLLGSDSQAQSIRSYINGDSQTNGIPFGLAMVAGTAPAQGAVDRKVVLPTAADGEFLGVGVHTHAMNNIGLGSSGSNGCPQLGQLSVVDFGDVWVKVEEAVLADDPAYVRFTSDGGSNTQIGSFRKSVDSGRAVRLPGAKYLTAAAAAGYALLQYRKPGPLSDKLFDIRIDLAQITATTTSYLFTVPSDRYFKLVSASLYIATTGVTLDTSNYYAMQLQGHTSNLPDLANYSTHDTAITAATLAAMTLSTTVAPPSTIVELVETLTGTKTRPAMSVILTGYYL